MKKLILVLSVVLSAVCCYSQVGVFQSPYKDGRPVADSLKDYSQPKGINLLSAERTAVPLKQDSKVSNQQPGNTTDEKTKPVVLSPAKKP